MKIKLAIALLAAAGLAGAPFAASAKSYKHHSKHQSSMSTTTGANMKSNARSGGASAGGSSQGNVGPGTNNLSGPQGGGR